MDTKLKIAKFATKFVIGAAGSAVIGYLIKTEKHIGAGIDAYFEKKSN